MGRQKAPQKHRRPAESQKPEVHTDDRTTKADFTVLIAVAAFHAGVIAAGLLLGPHARVWGMNPIAYLLHHPIVVLLAIAPLAYVVLVRTERGQSLMSQPRFLQRFAWFAGLGMLVTTLWMLFTGGVPALLGDGSYYRSEVYRAMVLPNYTPTYFKPSAMLTGFVIEGVARVFNLHNVGHPFVITSGLVFAILVAYVLLLARKHGMMRIVPPAILIVLTPASLILCGYVELYTPGYGAILGLLITIALHAQTGRQIGAMIAWCLAAVAFTLPALVFVPVVAYLAWNARARGEAQLQTHTVLALIGAAAVFLAAMYAVIGVRTEHVFLLHLLPAEYVNDGISYGTLDYSVFSAEHLADLLNMLVLIGGAWIPVLAMAHFRRDSASRMPQSVKGAALLAVTIALLFLLTMNTALGMSRDWDVASLPALLIPLAGVLTFAAMQKHDRRTAQLLLPLLMLVQGSAWYTWVIVNTDATTAPVRTADLVTQDLGHIRKDNSYFGYENIRKLYVTARNDSMAFVMQRRMLETGYKKADTYAKILAQIVDVSDRRDIRHDIDATAKQLLADAEHPYPPDDYRFISLPLLKEYAAQLAIIAANSNLLDRGARLHDDFLRVFGTWKSEPMVRVWLAKNVPVEEVLQAVTASIDSSTIDPMTVMTGTVALYNAGYVKQAALYLDQIIRKNPRDYPLAYLRLADIFLAVNAKEQARQALNQCISMCVDPDGREQARKKLQSIR